MNFTPTKIQNSPAKQFSKTEKKKVVEKSRFSNILDEEFMKEKERQEEIMADANMFLSMRQSFKQKTLRYEVPIIEEDEYQADILFDQYEDKINTLLKDKGYEIQSKAQTKPGSIGQVN